VGTEQNAGILNCPSAKKKSQLRYRSAPPPLAPRARSFVARSVAAAPLVAHAPDSKQLVDGTAGRQYADRTATKIRITGCGINTQMSVHGRQHILRRFRAGQRKRALAV